MAGNNIWQVLVDGSTATTALAAPVPSLTLPATKFDVAGKSRARVVFGGTDAANETINFLVVLWSKIGTQLGGVAASHMPETAAAGAATLGTAVYTVAGPGAATNLFADTITLTTDRYAYAYSPADNTVAFLDIDCSGADWIEVETDLGTGASADVIIKTFDGGPGSDTADMLASLSTLNTSVGTVNTTLGSPAQDEQVCPTLVDTEVVTVTATTGALSALLTTASEAALASTVKTMTLKNMSGVTIYYNSGAAATTAKGQLAPGESKTFTGTKALFDAIQFIVASGTASMSADSFGV